MNNHRGSGIANCELRIAKQTDKENNFLARYQESRAKAFIFCYCEDS